MKWLREQVDDERRQGSKHVHMHASCPCTAGSPIRSLSGNGNYDFRFAELEETVKRLPEYEKIADGTSLEWPVCNSLWKCDGVEKGLKTMKLTHEGLCIQPGSSHRETIEVCFKKTGFRKLHGTIQRLFLCFTCSFQFSWLDSDWTV